MKPFYKIFYFACLLPLFSLAQSNYKPGYVVTLNGDTVHGFIDYREWGNNPDAIAFKTMADGKSQKYTTGEIRFFSITNADAYQKYTGRISTDVVNTDHLTTGKDTSFKVVDVFLKVLQKGKNVALYSYTDDLKPRYFIGESLDFVPKELVYRIYEANDANGNGKTFTDETYLKQLNTLAIKYGALNEDLAYKLQKADYQKPALILIASKINNITNEEFQAKYNDKTGTYFYAGIAANIASITPSAGSSYLEAGGKSNTSVLPAFNVGINIFVNPNTERLAFRFELGAALIKYSSVYDNKFSPYVNITYGYTSLALSLSPQIIYSFYSKPAFKIYGGGGVQLTEYTYFSKQYKNNKDGTMVPTAADPFDFQKFNIPVVLKAGFIINTKLDINARYLFTAPVSDDYVFRLNTSAIQVGVNYRFN